MKVSLNWLKDYVTIDAADEEIASKLTMIGLEVEGIERISLNYSGVVVGSVLSKEKHPNADKLSVCQVDVGAEVLNIVCGAPNVDTGQTVAVATVGAVIDNFKIKPVKLRGVKSFGMICSERELGLSENHDGILVLDSSEYTLGESYKPANFEEDVIFEVNVTPNRPDCLSLIGIARELACAAETDLKKPETPFHESEQSVEELVSIQVQDQDACPRYVARVINNVKIGPSPDWMKKRLEASGIRSINNLVDITNYVLMETGQPLHAFDYHQIAGQTIIVRKAEEKEHFTTLDGQSREMRSTDLMICDGEKPVAIAGVMGGENSEVCSSTTDILLESAYFDPLTIRKTAKRLGLSTEASQRFERGADPENALYAANRAAALYEKYASGEIANAYVDSAEQKFDSWSVILRFFRINQILGTSIEKDRILSILNGLELKTAIQNDDQVSVKIPTFRPDLTREIDLIEEIVRHHGYDVIEPSRSSVISLDLNENHTDVFIDRIKEIMTGMGFLETLSDSMVSEKHVTLLTKDIKAISITNPLSPDTAFMRTGLLPGLLDAIQWNINRSSSSLCFFETGKVFQYNSDDKPFEELELAIAITGKSRPAEYWQQKSEEFDFFALKGYLQSLMHQLNIDKFLLSNGNNPIFHASENAQIFMGKEIIGEAGRLASNILENIGLKQDVYAIRISLPLLQKYLNQEIKYKQIPRFPAVKRDLAMLADNDLPVSQIKKAILSKGGALLNSVNLFDLYQGDQIPGNQKSIAFSLEFVSDERTLTEKEIEPIMSAIIHEIKSTCHCTLRS